MRKIIPFLIVISFILFCRVGNNEDTQLADMFPALGTLAMAALISILCPKKKNKDDNNTPNIYPG